MIIVGFRHALQLGYSFPSPQNDVPITLRTFTIQAQAKNAPLHPSAPKMKYLKGGKYEFEKDSYYRRLSVRECARIQTFPDSFRFVYSNVLAGYKMVGNAVPPRLAEAIAYSIKNVFHYRFDNEEFVLFGYFKDVKHLETIIDNKLYYIREKFPVDLTKGTPKYLFLHNGENRMLFELAKEQPQKMTNSDLQKLGFEPHGGKYYGFKVLKQTRIPEFDLQSVKIRRTKAPFLMSLSELMKND